MDDDAYEELDEYQEALDAPAKWCWHSWASIQFSNIGTIIDTFGKIFHDTALHLRWHATHKAQQSVFDDTAREIAGLPEAGCG